MTTSAAKAAETQERLLKLAKGTGLLDDKGEQLMKDRLEQYRKAAAK